MFKRLIQNYRETFSGRDGVPSLFNGVLLFVFAILVQNLALRYVGQVTTIAVPDVILDHLPTFHIDALIIKAVLLVTVLTLILATLKPRFFAFGLKTLSLFIIIRAVLISLTHLGANPHQLVFDPHTFGYRIYDVLFNTTNDFFFSAHTGAPFLVALIFWEERSIRYLYILISFLFGVSVLVAHIHYSIDVLAAPFMTYAIFHLSKAIFSKDYAFSKRKLG